MRPFFGWLALALVGFAVTADVSFRTGSKLRTEAELIRKTERERLRALVDADMKVANQLHAADFQLINPLGETFSKEKYLGGIKSGEFDYVTWKPEEIEVRFYGRAAVIRYRSQLEIIVRGQKGSLSPHWHTDLYEKNEGRWQVVWSQATEIK